MVIAPCFYRSICPRRLMWSHWLSLLLSTFPGTHFSQTFNRCLTLHMDINSFILCSLFNHKNGSWQWLGFFQQSTAIIQCQSYLWLNSVYYFTDNVYILICQTGIHGPFWFTKSHDHQRLGLSLCSCPCYTILSSHLCIYLFVFLLLFSDAVNQL